MDRLERLINLVAALLDASKPLSRNEIKERVPGYSGDDVAWRRAFERDKEALRGMGVPIALEPLDNAYPEMGDGYRIHPEQYEMPDPGLTPDELAALHLANTAVRLGASPGSEITWKLGPSPSGNGGSGDSSVRPGDASQGLAALPESEHLPVLFQSIAECRTVEFDYNDARRVVDPYHLSFRNGRWYLAGHDHERNDQRSFRLDRLGSDPQPGDPNSFERPHEARQAMPPPWQMGGGEPIIAKLLVDADQADWAIKQIDKSATVDRRENGDVILMIPVTNKEAFRSFVVGFLDHAEIVEPPEFRDDMVAWLESMSAVAS